MSEEGEVSFWQKTEVENEENPEYMAINQYAMYRGVATPTISSARKKGIIKYHLVGGVQKVNVLEANAALDANIRVSSNNEEAGTGETYNQSRAKKESYTAKIKKLEYEEKEGSLINKQGAMKAVGEIAFQVKERLRTIPQKVAAELAAENDPRKLEIALQIEIDEALSALQDMRVL